MSHPIDCLSGLHSVQMARHTAELNSEKDIIYCTQIRCVCVWACSETYDVCGLVVKRVCVLPTMLDGNILELHCLTPAHRNIIT